MAASDWFVLLIFLGDSSPSLHLGSSTPREASPEPLFPPRPLALPVAPTKEVGSSLRIVRLCYLSYL